MNPALEELEAILLLPSEQARLVRFHTWKRRWVEQLHSSQLVDDLKFLMYQDRARLEEYVARDVAHSLGKLIADNPELTRFEQDRVDRNGDVLPSLEQFPPARMDGFPLQPYGQSMQRRTRTVLILRWRSK